MLMSEVLDIVRNVFYKYHHGLLAMPNSDAPNELRDVGNLVARIQTSLRLTTWEMAEIQVFWDYIRGSEAATDFITECTSEFYAHYITSEGVACATVNYTPTDTWDSLIDVLANALNIPRDPGVEIDYMVEDPDFYNRGFGVDGWVHAMHSNNWLVWVYLLKLADVKLMPTAPSTITWTRNSTSN